MRTHTIAVVMLMFLFRSGASAQTLPKRPISNPQPVPAPMQLLQQLMSVDPNGEPCDSKACVEGRAAALKSLGIPADADTEARLVLEDLDGDGVPEALFTVEFGPSDVTLVVLKQKGEQWYRLPSPPDFSCWCRYENSPIDSFVEIRTWSYSFEKPSLPRRLIFVHRSGGGTGLYERTVDVYALRNLAIQKVFRTTEERRECPWPEGKCEDRHVLITFEGDASGTRALVTREIQDEGIAEKQPPDKKQGSPDNASSEESWWVGLPVSSCQAYTWSTQEFKFAPDPKVTSAYCSGAGK